MDDGMGMVMNWTVRTKHVFRSFHTRFTLFGQCLPRLGRGGAQAKSAKNVASPKRGLRILLLEVFDPQAHP